VEIEADTVAETWELSLRELLANSGLLCVDSAIGGPSVEARAAVLRVRHPFHEPRIPDLYSDPDLIETYKSLLLRPAATPNTEAVQTVADRIHSYPSGTRRGIDQFAQAIKDLRRDPLSRRAIIQVWNPQEDLRAPGKASPSGHCFLQLIARDGAVELVAASRSIDAWIGAIPNILAFTELQQKAADRLGLAVGTYCQMIVSYHLYLRDIPVVLAALGDGT
jgi:hypothetical protein